MRTRGDHRPFGYPVRLAIRIALVVLAAPPALVMLLLCAVGLTLDANARAAASVVMWAHCGRWVAIGGRPVLHRVTTALHDLGGCVENVCRWVRHGAGVRR